MTSSGDDRLVDEAARRRRSWMRCRSVFAPVTPMPELSGSTVVSPKRGHGAEGDVVVAGDGDFDPAFIGCRHRPEGCEVVDARQSRGSWCLRPEEPSARWAAT